MDLRTRKYSAIEKIMEMDSESLLKLEISIDLIFSEGISLEQYNREIEEANDEIEKGIYLSHEDAVKEIQAWREK